MAHPLLETFDDFLTVNEFNDIVIPCRPTSPSIVPELEIETGEEVSHSKHFSNNLRYINNVRTYFAEC